MMQHNMLYLRQQSLNDQQVHIKKKNLRMLIVFLSASANFGNAFCGNSAAPLQREIQNDMNIIETDFNLLFSIRGLSNLFMPFLIGTIVEKFGFKYCLMLLCTFCTIGQMFFAIGLSLHNYHMLLMGRFIFGLSDSVSIFQQTILCYWFEPTQLPFVFGILLFMVKIVRAINDNVASVYFNATGSLASYFWIGFVVCLGSLISAFYLTTIHESVCESTQSNATREKEQELKQNQQKDLESQNKDSEESSNATPKKEKVLKEDYVYLLIMYMFGFSVIISFYPNLSCLLQERFAYSNEDAGHVASLPYLIASFATPLFGSLIQKMGESQYEFLLTLSTGLIFLTQMHFTLMSDAIPTIGNVKTEPNNMAIIPISLFGIGHALFVTLQGPLINKTITDKSNMPKALSIMKVAENIGGMFLTFIAAYVKVQTNSFIGVHMLYALFTLIPTVLGYHFIIKLNRKMENEKQKKTKDAISDGNNDDIELEKQSLKAKQSLENSPSVNDNSDEEIKTEISISDSTEMDCISEDDTSKKSEKNRD
ncbi:major facilitator superfamily domain-containing protein 1 [Stylonychia lemnae]|uniref:Lysosomal dipeptide transporter MFSD1 n=1 Tax=Stylonychia lemnae TaxID=5949 RepID=A0A078B4Y4_STYLE|nr:major facilitator superfamily domain-containing protein 1 [Stylonychia lemnae]|eukprot:CDW88287.1 major facilitator superfamily domain-containing protein 1 [Stylonychia lemnae]